MVYHGTIDPRTRDIIIADGPVVVSGDHAETILDLTLHTAIDGILYAVHTDAAGEIGAERIETDEEDGATRFAYVIPGNMTGYNGTAYLSFRAESAAGGRIQRRWSTKLLPVHIYDAIDVDPDVDPDTMAIITEALEAAETVAALAEKVGEAAETAVTAADRAEEAAEQAESAASTAGYMQMEIDQHGHLIYTRNSAAAVDFSLENGRLIMEVE